MIASVCSAILGLYNLSFWQHLSSVASWPFMIAVGVLLFAILYFIITLVNYRYTLKPFIIFFLLIASISAFAMDTFGFVVSTQAFQTFAETDYHEVYDLLSWKLVTYIICLFVIPSILVLKHKVIYPGFKRNCIVAGLCVLVISGDIVLFSKNYLSFIRNHRVVRYYANPMRPIYSMAKYAISYWREGGGLELAILDNNPRQISSRDKPRLVVLVLGESDRSMNQQLNGYPRATNPLLSARNDVLSFNDVSACGTETSISVPCMFSVFPRQDYSYYRGKYTENVLDLLNKSDIRVLWRDNDSGCKGVCDRVELEDFNFAKIEPYCNSFECHDEVLLYNLQQKIDEVSTDQLLVLHKKGNHGPAYHKRYPDKFKKFVPTCDTHELHECTDSEIVNTYDNIIVYTDYFLNEVIGILENNSDTHRTAMLYISDHGESLGENGIYLHAMPYWIAPKEQTHVPFFIWTSKDFAINNQSLQQNLKKELSHDYLFHTLLSMFDISTTAYASHLDLFHGVAAHSQQ